MMIISVGVILGYAIQFFIPIQIMFPVIRAKFMLADSHPLAMELLFRMFMVLVTFSVALLVPNLGLLISLIGAICSTSLALVFPVVIEYLVLTRDDQPLDMFTATKIVLILVLAAVGFISGGYESINQIIHLYGL
jgi:solute carrier family 36 (proton-coupled amino acid transporter)